MRTKNNLNQRSGSSTPPVRDVDLLDSDQFLSGEELDELWEWFYTAIDESVDPELVFVKIINSARNPYRNHIPPGYHRNTGSQDLISLEQEDGVEQLKNQITCLRADISAKDHLIGTLEARDERYRESEKELVREIAEKDREIEKLDSRLQVLEQNETRFEARLADVQEESLQKTKSIEERIVNAEEERKILHKKNDELIELLEGLTREQLHNGELYREALGNKTQELEHQKQLAESHEEKVKQIEEELAGREKELQEMGNDYGRRLAEKEKEIENKQANIEELRLTIEDHTQIIDQRVSECETKHMESRRDLVATVCRALAKKSLTPISIGLQDEEWKSQDSTTPVALHRSSWGSWRS